jgi:hypothetical protein
MKILVVSHDAAGAELVSSYVQQNPNNEYNFILGNVAQRIFSKKVNSLQNLSSDRLKEVVKDHDCLLTGTSQDSDLEKQAIRIAKKYNVKAITFLDYWRGYRERFTLNANVHLPNEIWVVDKYALAIARETFPDANIILKENPYLNDLLKEKKNIHYNDNNGEILKIIYLCQPYNENNISDIFAIDYFLSITSKRISKKVEIRLRLHPLEKKEKYNNIINKYLNIFKVYEVDTNSLAEDLTWADWAVGMNAQALAVAVDFGLNVFHCMPSSEIHFVLPHKEITSYEMNVIGLDN